MTALTLAACSGGDAPESSQSAASSSKSSEKPSPGGGKPDSQGKDSDKSRPQPTRGNSSGGSGSSSGNSNTGRGHNGGDSKPTQAPAGGGHNINAGQVGGDCGTTSQGDEIEAGSNTSCELAAAAFDAAMAADYYKWTPDPTVTSIHRTEISVTSPTNGQTYALTCTIGQDGQNLGCGKRPTSSEDLLNQMPGEAPLSMLYYRGPAGHMLNRVNTTD